MNIQIHPKLVKKFISQQKDGEYLGIRLQPSGCNGWMFKLEPTDHVKEIEEHSFISHGIHFVVMTKHMPFIEDLHINLEKVGLQEQVVFNTPLVNNQCGCGASVQFKKGMTP